MKFDGFSLWKGFLGLCCLLGLLAFPQARGAEIGAIPLTDRVSEVSLDGRARFWIDTAPPGLQLDVQALEARAATLPWRLREPNHQYPIDDRVLWFQFDAQTDQDDAHWYVELAASGLDRVVLYYRDRDGDWVSQEAGDSKPVSAWPLPGRFPTFQLSHETGEPVRYWLRVESARVNFSAPIEIRHLSSLAITRDREQFLMGAYFGLVILVTLVATVSALAWRDRDFASYGVYVAILGLGQAAYLGTGAQYLWTDFLEWNRVSTFVLPALSAAAGLWFVRRLAEPARYSHLLDRLSLATLLVLPSVTVIDALVPLPSTYTVITLLILVALALVGLMIAIVWLRGDEPDIRLVALGFAPVAVFALFPVARTLGIIPIGFLTRYGLPIGAALEMPILLYALNLRSARRRDAQVRTQVLATTDPLTGLSHHRILLLRLETALLRSRKQNQPLPGALLVVKMANLDTLRATHGAEAAERALVFYASRLRHVISEADVAARVGEQQFALLLDGPVTHEEAHLCAAHVVAPGLRESQVLPEGVSLSLHVACAMLPAGPKTAQQTLEWVMAAANAMPENDRSAIQPLNFQLVSKETP